MNFMKNKKIRIIEEKSRIIGELADSMSEKTCLVSYYGGQKDIL